MDRMFAKIGLLASLVLGCTVEVDLRELKFPDPDSGGSGEELGQIVDEIPCSKFFHCVVSAGAEPAVFEECADRVQASEQEAIGELESCREQRCSTGGLAPGSPAFNPEDMIGCLFGQCAERLVDCTIGHGDDSCLAYAVTWKNLWEQAVACREDLGSLCEIDSLALVSSDEKAKMADLLKCLNLVKNGFQDYSADCLPYCE